MDDKVISCLKERIDFEIKYNFKSIWFYALENKKSYAEIDDMMIFFGNLSYKKIGTKKSIDLILSKYKLSESELIEICQSFIGDDFFLDLCNRIINSMK